MHTMDPVPPSAMELWREWGGAQRPPWPRPIPSPEGRVLLAYEQAAAPLWVEAPVPVHQLDGRLAWRVALQGLIVHVRRLQIPVAFVRPLELGELPQGPAHQDQLQCSGPEFARRRDRALRQLATGRKLHLFLAQRHRLLAVMEAYPPTGHQSLDECARQEAQTLRRLRSSRMRHQELLRLLEIFDQQANGPLPPSNEQQPFVRVISYAEDLMLRELRQRSIRTRAQLRQELDPSVVDPSSLYPLTPIS